MRELKDYFCTYEQTQELMQLGLSLDEYLHHITPSNTLSKHIFDYGVGAILNSQALDFFRDLGWEFYIEPYTEINSIGRLFIADHTYNYYIFKNQHYVEDQIEVNTPVLAERELISRLIELEKEARNGN